MEINCIDAEKKAYKFTDVLSSEGLHELQNYITELPFQVKDHSDYKCSTYFFSEEHQDGIIDMIRKYIPFKEIESFLREKYEMDIHINKFGEVVKLQKGDFLNWHDDGYNVIQCVLHFDNGEPSDGGMLHFRDAEIVPEKNSVIAFYGGTDHKVSPITSDTTRYSISFGCVL